MILLVQDYWFLTMHVEGMQLRTTLFYILYGLLNIGLIGGLYFNYPLTVPYVSVLVFFFFYGLLCLYVALRLNSQLVRVKELNKQIIGRLDANVAQQAQHLKLAALGRFSASIAHELRNPLGAISHAVQLLGDKGLNDEDLRLKQLVIKNCEKMNAVIKNVLQLTRRQPSQPQLIDLLPFLEQFKQDFCHSNPCDMTVSVTPHELRVLFDKSQLDQILVILCDNAKQHGQDADGLVRIMISAAPNGSYTVLTINDNGKGIAVAHSNDIFEPFFTTLRGGTGMGLFIAKDLCEMNQSRLSLEKSVIGSCFTITINP